MSETDYEEDQRNFQVTEPTPNLHDQFSPSPHTYQPQSFSAEPPYGESQYMLEEPTDMLTGCALYLAQNLPNYNPMKDQNLITDIIGRVLEKQKALMNQISYTSLHYRSPRRFKRKNSSGRAYVRQNQTQKIPVTLVQPSKKRNHYESMQIIPRHLRKKSSYARVEELDEYAMAASLDTASLHYTDLHKSVDSEHMAESQIVLKHDESSIFRTHQSSVESRKTRKSPQLPELNPVKRFEKQMNQKLKNYKPVLRNSKKIISIDQSIATPKLTKQLIPSLALASPKKQLSPMPSKAKLKSPHPRRNKPVSLSIGTSQELSDKILQLPDLTPTHRFSSGDFSHKKYSANTSLWALAAAKKEQMEGGHRFSKWIRRQNEGKSLKPLFNKFGSQKGENGMGPVREELGQQV